jgi:uncharacterized protein
MGTQIFVNLPVKDLDRSIDFFKHLGYDFDPKFTDQNAACIIISEHIYVMLLVEEYFQSFTNKEIADVWESNEVMLALTMNSRKKVDELVSVALASGGFPHLDPKDHGFMYEWGFIDPDGHIWRIFYMDPDTAVNSQ